MFFRCALGLFGTIGLIANTLLIGLATHEVYQDRFVFHTLKQNPRAFTREIDPNVIASLEGPPLPLWISHCVLALCAAFGMMLALELLVIMYRASAGLGVVDSRLSQYSRLKPVGALATAIAFVWAHEESFDFWTAATRHYSVGGSQSLMVGIPLLLAALIPWWLVRRSLKQSGDKASRS